ncbi:hypothetical protein Pelo_9122 [Pelomyxa schiedti]|nr:hypothetical protein Pelo_9122 [Pelomyxa schiedti]
MLLHGGVCGQNGVGGGAASGAATITSYHYSQGGFIRRCLCVRLSPLLLSIVGDEVRTGPPASATCGITRLSEHLLYVCMIPIIYVLILLQDACSSAKNVRFSAGNIRLSTRTPQNRERTFHIVACLYCRIPTHSWNVLLSNDIGFQHPLGPSICPCRGIMN